MLPKLAVKIFSYPGENIIEFEQAREKLDFDTGIVVLEGERATSYDELVQLAGQEKHQGKETLEVVLIPAIIGG